MASKTRQPVQVSDNLKSKATMRLIDLLSEGPIQGFVNPFQSIKADGVPIQTTGGSFNITNAKLAFRDGQPTQRPIPGFVDTENDRPVNKPVSSRSNFVGAVYVDNGGSGYTWATVSLVGGLGQAGQRDNGTPWVPTANATAHATVENGRIKEVIIDLPGENYITPPQVVITGDGAGASCSAELGNTATYRVQDPLADAVRVGVRTGALQLTNEFNDVAGYYVHHKVEYRTQNAPRWRMAPFDSSFIPSNGGETLATTAVRKLVTVMVPARSSYTLRLFGSNMTTGNYDQLLKTVTGYNASDAPALIYETVTALDLEFGVWYTAINEAGGAPIEVVQDTFLNLLTSEIVISGRTSSGYGESYRFDIPTDQGWVEIRSIRSSTDDFTKYHTSSLAFDVCTEIQSSTMMYSDSAIVAWELDADYMNAVPKRTYDIYGRIVRVPTNYDPAARAYGPFWDGTFKYAWTDNPAWIFLDLLTHDRYGLGNWVDDSVIDKGALYLIAKHCDELVPGNEAGTFVPRWTFNKQIMTANEAYSVLNTMASVFKGMIYWSAGTIFATQDRPGPVRRTVSPSKVIGGDISYVGVSAAAMHSVARVEYNDETREDGKGIEIYEDAELIEKLGYVPTDVVAFACTSRHEARRVGKWLIDSEKYANKIATFRAGFEFADAVPGDIIAIADPNYAGVRQGGRFLQPSANGAKLDRAYAFESSQTYTMTANVPTMGRVASTRGSDIIQGRRTFWADAFYGLKAGDLIIFGTEPKQYEVKEVHSNTQIRLDQPYVGQATRSVHWTVLRDNSLYQSSFINLLEVPINNPGDTETDTVVFSRPLPVSPQVEADWLLSASNVVPRQFRVQSVRPVEKGRFEVVALEHDPNKYLRVEQDIAILPPVTTDIAAEPVQMPKNLDITESTFLRRNVSLQRITLSWEDGSVFSPASGYYISARLPDGTFENLGFTSNLYYDYDEPTPGTYTFYVTALGTSGDYSLPAEKEYTATLWEGQAGPVITNLAVVGGYGPQSQFFSGRAPVIKWDVVFPAGIPSYPAENVIRIYDADTDALLRVVQTAASTYTYAFEDNYEDGGRVPRRKMRFSVTVKDLVGRESAPKVVVAYNPPPDAVNVELGSTSELLAITISGTGDPDLAGYLVWISQTPNINTLTTPPTLDVTTGDILQQATPNATYYVRAAAYDVFGKDQRYLNASVEKSKKVTILLFDPEAPAIPSAVTLVSNVIEVAADGRITSRITISWPAVGSSNLGFYEVFKADGVNPTPGLYVGGNTTNGTTMSFAGLMPGQTYNFYVRTHSANGFAASEASPILSVVAALNTTPPSLPTNFVVEASFEAANLRWTNPPEKDLAGIEIWVGPTSAGGTLVTTVAAPMTFYRHPMQGQASLWFWIRSINTSGYAYGFVGPIQATSPLIQAAQLAAQIIDETKVAASLLINKTVSTLPTVKGSEQVTYQGKVYRWDATVGAYVPLVRATDIDGKILAASIDTINAEQIRGQVAAANLAGIEASKVTGTLRNDQLDDIQVAKIAGQIPDTKIAALDAAKLTGNLDQARISALNAGKIVGQIVGTQISDNSISTGKIAAGQIVTSHMVAGTINASVLTALSISTDKLAANAITASKLAVQSNNMAFNPDLSQGSRGWVGNGDMPGIVNRATVSTAWGPDGFKSIFCQSSATAAQCAGKYWDISSLTENPDGSQVRYPVSAGITYEFSACISSHRCSGVVFVGWVNSAGTVISYVSGSPVVNNQYNRGSYSAHPKTKFIGVAPAGAVTALVFFRMYDVVGDAPYLFVSAAMIAATQAGATETSPYVAPGVTTIDGANVSTGSLHANRITAYTITADQMAANSIVAGSIQSGAIVTRHMTAGTIDASVITAGTITTGLLAASAVTAVKIAANAITASKIYVSDLTNMIPNGDFLDGSGDGWVLTNGVLEAAPATDPGGQWRVRCAGTPSTGYVAGYWGQFIQVTPGDDIYASCMLYNARTTTAGGLLLEFYAQDNTNYQARYVYDNSKNYWSRVQGRVTVPSGTQKMRVVLFADPYDGPAFFGKVQVRRASSAELIVDGAISARTIASDAIEARHIKVDAINAGHISAGAIGVSELAAGAVTAEKIGVGLSSGNLIWNSDQALTNYAVMNGNFAGTLGWSPDWRLTGTQNSIFLHHPTVVNVGYYAYFDLHVPLPTGGSFSLFPCTGDQYYELSVYISVHRCSAYAQLIFFDANQVPISNIQTQTIPHSQWAGAPNDAWRARTIGYAPANTAYALVRGVMNGTDQEQPYAFFSGFYAGKVAPGTTAYSPYTPQSRTIITGEGISTGSLHANRIIANTITGDQIAANSIHANRIQANTITGDQIAGNSIHGNRITAGTITATEIAANSISASRLTISMRPMTIAGINFYMEVNGNGDKTGWMVWSSGYLNVLGDGSEQATFAIAPGSIYTGFQETHVWWDRGAGYLSARVGGSDIISDTRIAMASWTAATGLLVLKGGTTIDGDRISTRSIKAVQIAVGAIQATHIGAGQINSDHINVGVLHGNRIIAGTLSASAITAGYLTVGAEIYIGNNNRTMLWSDGNGGGLRMLDRSGNYWRGTFGYIGPWTGDANDYGMIVWGNDNAVKIRISNAQNYIDGVIIGDATIGNAKIQNLTLGNEKIQNNAATQGAGVNTGAGTNNAVIYLNIRRAGTNVGIWVNRTGTPSQQSQTGSNTGVLKINVALPGQGFATVRAIPNNFMLDYVSGIGASYVRHMPGSDFLLYYCEYAGVYAFQVHDDSAATNTAVSMCVVEFSK